MLLKIPTRHPTANPINGGAAKIYGEIPTCILVSLSVHHSAQRKPELTTAASMPVKPKISNLCIISQVSTIPLFISTRSSKSYAFLQAPMHNRYRRPCKRALPPRVGHA
jgi:hypothetical protein